MIQITYKNNSALINMQSYPFRQRGKKKIYIPKIHSFLSKKIDFNIYDYQMLFNDEKTKELIRSGRTIGCFYIESPGMRSLLKQLSCDTFEMLTAASSVIRPGVAQSGMMKEFIARHKNPAMRKYLIPEMAKYLKETYGIMIYQEDVIRIAHHIVGLSLEKADLLRRAMSGKMRSHKAMRQLQNNFFESCNSKGLSKNVTCKLWKQIESFAGYAFCKAHSASFALLSFQVAYLKAHYPAEFMASVLSNRGGYYSAGTYINEAKRMGLRILLPSINKSNYEYLGYNKEIRIGLTAIKNISRKSIDKIIKERENNGSYTSLSDFLVRTKIRPKETATLIRCGAMDCFGKTRITLMRLLDIYKHSLHKAADNLFAFQTIKLENEVTDNKQYTINEICSTEYEIFGYMVSRHPLHFFNEIINCPQIVKAAEISKYNGKYVKMIGWFMASKKIKTRKGEIMKFLSLEDLTGTFEAVIFPNIYRRYAELTLSMGPYLVEGIIDTKNNYNIIVKKLKILSTKWAAGQIQKDTTENNYFGDIEKINKEEFHLVKLLSKNKLKGVE